MAWYQSDLQYTPPKPYVPPTWADGTDEEIVEALEKHYNDEIDLHDYWNVGDERVISLSSIGNGGYVGESHSAQNITMVLLHAGGKTLVTPINGHTECVFIVGQKNCLGARGYMYPSTSDYTAMGWGASNRRKWCNDSYKNAFPLSIINIFKQHYNYVASNYNTTSPSQYADYFCLPSVKEIYGSTGITSISSDALANEDAEANNVQLDYYKASNVNKLKYLGNSGSSGIYYWTSSKRYYTSSTDSYKRQMMIKQSDIPQASAVSNTQGIAPQGVI